MSLGRLQAALARLALNFHQSVADLTHQGDADRLIVDKGPRPAVGAQYPAQDQPVTVAKTMVVEQLPYRMIGRRREFSGDPGLINAPAQQAAVTPAAENQPQGIEQNGLAGAGLAGQGAQAGAERQVEPIDQYDVADG